MIEDLCVSGRVIHYWRNHSDWSPSEWDDTTFKQAAIHIGHTDQSHFSHTYYTHIWVLFLQFSQNLVTEMSALILVRRGCFLKIPKNHFLFLTFLDNLTLLFKLHTKKLHTLYLLFTKYFHQVFFFFFRKSTIKKKYFCQKNLFLSIFS